MILDVRATRDEFIRDIGPVEPVYLVNRARLAIDECRLPVLVDRHRGEASQGHASRERVLCGGADRNLARANAMGLNAAAPTGCHLRRAR